MQALQQASKTLCILRLSAIGDCTHIVPIVRTLQQYWPKTKITWIIGKLEHMLVGDIEGIEFIVFDKSQGPKAYNQLYKDLQDRKFDILLNMQISLRASIASLFIKAPFKLGYDKARAKDKQWLFTNQRIAAVEHQHVLDSFFEFTKIIGIKDKILKWNIPIPKAAQDFVTKNIKIDQPVLAINPCSSKRSRNWSIENYAAVASYAITQHNMQVVLTGGSTELEINIAANIQRICQQPLINLVGKTKIKEMLAVLNRADIMISPDTGPAHMATTVGTPVIGLYATSNPYRTGPYLSINNTINEYPRALQEEFGLSVEQAKWGQRVHNPKVMNMIKKTQVILMLDKLHRQHICY